jgi:hypothetical protein
MVAKRKTKGEKAETRRLNIDKLKLKKETVQDLDRSEQKGIKGGGMCDTKACASKPK